MKLTLIAAMDNNQLIGSNNDLPWRLPADLKFFKQQTNGKTLLMGRKTCESLPFPLPNRRNVVISRNTDFSREGFETINNITAIDDLKVNELMVIGGAKIYELMMDKATHMILTKINSNFEGDTYFPKIDWEQWRVQRKTNNPISDENPEFSFDFVFYEKLTEANKA